MFLLNLPAKRDLKKIPKAFILKEVLRVWFAENLQQMKIRGMINMALNAYHAKKHWIKSLFQSP